MVITLFIASTIGSVGYGMISSGQRVANFLSLIVDFGMHIEGIYKIALVRNNKEEIEKKKRETLSDSVSVCVRACVCGYKNRPGMSLDRCHVLCTLGRHCSGEFDHRTTSSLRAG